MINVFRKIIGAGIFLGGLVFAAAVIIGGFVANCVWLMACVIADRGR